MFADSSGKFQVNVQVQVSPVQSFKWMAEKPSSVNLYSLTWTMLLSSKITNTLAVGLEAESFAKQNTG